MQYKLKETDKTNKTARYTLRLDVNDERKYETICYIERKHQTTGMTYTDIIVEAMLYWLDMFRCDEYPENINLVGAYFNESDELRLKTRKALIRNPDYIPDITEDDILQKYLDQVNAMPKLQIEE
jgi:hypothetical protein